MAGLIEFVSRRPEMGLAVRGLPAEFGSWVTKPLPSRNRVQVIYHYDQDKVTLLDARLIPDFDAFGRPH